MDYMPTRAMAKGGSARYHMSADLTVDIRLGCIAVFFRQNRNLFWRRDVCNGNCNGPA